MYDEKMKAKHEAIRRIMDEMDNMMMGKMMPKEEEYEEEEEAPVKIKVMKIEAEPEDDYSMDSEEGEPIDMEPIKELRKKLRGK
jgi:hypothetical protein